MTFLKNLIYTTSVITFIAIFTPQVCSATTAAEVRLPKNQIRTNSGGALSSSKITDTPFLFQTGFNSTTWSGHLTKKGISQHADGRIIIANQALWDAGVRLSTLQNPAHRTITTYNPVIKQTVEFEWGQLPTEIQSLFHISPTTKIDDKAGAARVSYLRGVRTMENKSTDPTIPEFRVRDSVLGDIIHSGPVYVGTPAKNLIGPGYFSFYDHYKKRPGTVFVGANDGMLHAFSADSGQEFFAYIPGPLLRKLPKLTDPNYQHEPMMDGNLHVSEAQVAGQWKTVLAAGMGYGAKGVFALDVTLPDQFMSGKRALFEFTEQDDPDIGYVTSAPAIAKISIGKNKNGKPDYQYFVAVSSGEVSNPFNSTNPTNINNGNQFLFLLSLDKDPNIPWFKNSNYYKLSTNSNNASTANAITAPALVLNARGAAIYGYSGDLQGNVWRFDFTGDRPDSITPTIIFTAKDKDNNPQAITVQPIVSFAPGGGHLILFGTGDNANSVKDQIRQNSFYAIRDTTKNKKDDYFINGRSQLAARTLVATTVHGKSGVQVTGHDFSYDNSALNKKGWYVDYQHDYSNDPCGERTISKAVLAFGSVFFNTVIPTDTICNSSNANGTSMTYTVNAMSGKPNDTNSLAGLPSHVGGSGTPLLITTKLSSGTRDSTGRRFNHHDYSILNVGTGGIHGASEVTNAGQAILKTGRLSWREISNWQDMKK